MYLYFSLLFSFVFCLAAWKIMWDFRRRPCATLSDWVSHIHHLFGAQWPLSRISNTKCLNAHRQMECHNVQNFPCSWCHRIWGQLDKVWFLFIIIINFSSHFYLIRFGVLKSPIHVNILHLWYFYGMEGNNKREKKK